MLHLHQKHNIVKFLVVTFCLSITGINLSISQTISQAQTIKESKPTTSRQNTSNNLPKTPNSSNTPVNNAPKTPANSSPNIPTPKIHRQQDNPLDLTNDRWWQSTKTTSQPLALQFEKTNNKKEGRLNIWYRYSSGTFSRFATYKLVDYNPKQCQKDQSCFIPIDIVLDNDTTVQTIFSIEYKQGKDKNKTILRIELAGLKPGAPRPNKFSEKGVKEFSIEFVKPY